MSETVFDRLNITLIKKKKNLPDFFSTALLHYIQALRHRRYFLSHHLSNILDHKSSAST